MGIESNNTGFKVNNAGYKPVSTANELIHQARQAKVEQQQELKTALKQEAGIRMVDPGSDYISRLAQQVPEKPQNPFKNKLSDSLYKKGPSKGKSSDKGLSDAMNPFAQGDLNTDDPEIGMEARMAFAGQSDALASTS